MFKFEFILPSIFGICVSMLILKEDLFNLGMNVLTWGVYIVNLFIVYILIKMGRVIDECLGL